MQFVFPSIKRCGQYSLCLNLDGLMIIMEVTRYVFWGILIKRPDFLWPELLEDSLLEMSHYTERRSMIKSLWRRPRNPRPQPALSSQLIDWQQSPWQSWAILKGDLSSCLTLHGGEMRCPCWVLPNCRYRNQVNEAALRHLTFGCFVMQQYITGTNTNM